MVNKLSSFWDIEKRKGKLVVHNDEKVIVEIISHEQSLEKFNNWSEKITPFIKWKYII
ncbi:hypothetical protein [Alkalicoccobacillus plakortidis]|uniref:Uncharacterized protein n=1 Tax=Alkalicoccobacillus plakortidis TaxID=444060 RepID=A0ABT0XJZ4_9BACI|nr:hypothetical protein [Alkalicoccobacillus plakortidis]MCM2675554.1 hypothetical protein [Alkalicoccobacillus plakortidis]